MVNSDTGLPDPDNPNNEVRPTNDVILVTDDEEDSDDQETVILDEYQPLPTEDTASFNQSSSEDEAHGFQALNRSTPSTNSLVIVITPMEETLVKEFWAAPPPKSVDIEMDNKKVDEVKQAMVNVVLPSSSIPEWAANIPEEDWKKQLLSRIQNIQEKDK